MIRLRVRTAPGRSRTGEIRTRRNVRKLTNEMISPVRLAREWARADGDFRSVVRLSLSSPRETSPVKLPGDADSLEIVYRDWCPSGEVIFVSCQRTSDGTGLSWKDEDEGGGGEGRGLFINDEDGRPA